MEKNERARNGKKIPIISHRHPGDLLPCPCCCTLGLGCYSEFRDSERFRAKNQASPAGQRKEGNHSKPLGEGQGKQKVAAPTCLPPFLSLRAVAMEQTEEGTCYSRAAPGALALLLKTGQLTLHSTLVTAAAVLPFQFHSIPCSNTMLITDAEKLKYQPAWLRQDLQPLRDSITAATLLSAY